ncbi:hypothetical protein RND71_016558 [Anisodus tanguticus]|uniref:Uncharacterized protein n=1 Tax=Anisodus tanguticus TaxID=243964 RepID=A0AAE1VMA9_9SOLA|nr:hypothetical protein RND71_016558 [Anisodus tanguticus]
MEPQKICKMVGRPKVKRGRVRNENLKRQGEWSSSRKGKPMTCSTCHQSEHNARGCAKQPLATPTRIISFVGDSTGMSQPTNMPYQPPNRTIVIGNKLRVTKEKMKTRKENEKSQAWHEASWIQLFKVSSVEYYFIIIMSISEVKGGKRFTPKWDFSVRIRISPASNRILTTGIPNYEPMQAHTLTAQFLKKVMSGTREVEGGSSTFDFCCYVLFSSMRTMK